ncbi:hypothetical protein F4811DRAFT_557593 [Daldinia bambusicola]|nr:hypothetical protein F4811DRAFT_557593 [Daldinia bambusicola]
MTGLLEEFERCMRSAMRNVSLLSNPRNGEIAGDLRETFHQNICLVETLAKDMQRTRNKLRAGYEGLDSNLSSYNQGVQKLQAQELELQAEDRRLRDLRESLDTEQNKLRKNLAGLESRSKALEVGRAEHEAQLNMLAEESTSLDLRQQNLNGQARALGTRREVLEEDRESLRVQLKKLRADLDSLGGWQKKLDKDRDAQLRRLAEDQGSLRAQQKKLEEDQDAQLRKLDEDRDLELEAEKNTLTQGQDSLEAERKKLDGARDALAAQSTALRRDSDTLVTQKAKLKKDRDSCQSQPDAQVESLNKDRDTLRAERGKLGEEKAAVQAQQEQLSAERAALEHQKLDVAAEQKRLRETSEFLVKKAIVEAVDSVGNTVSLKIDQLSEDLITAKDVEIMERDQRIEELDSEKRDREEKLRRSFAEESNLRDQREDLTERLHSDDPKCRWQHVSDDMAVFISRFRPSVEEGCLVPLDDTVMSMMPPCRPSRENQNIESFLVEARTSTWYCFEQVLQQSPSHPGCLVRDGEPCEEHGIAPASR